MNRLSALNRERDMKVKTAELEGWRLDWAVARATKLGQGYGLHLDNEKLYLVDGSLFSSFNI